MKFEEAAIWPHRLAIIGDFSPIYRTIKTADFLMMIGHDDISPGIKMRMDFGMVHKWIQLLINMHQSRCKCSRKVERESGNRLY